MRLFQFADGNNLARSLALANDVPVLMDFINRVSGLMVSPNLGWALGTVVPPAYSYLGHAGGFLGVRRTGRITG